MPDPSALGGRVVVLDHAPNATLLNVLRGVGLTVTVVSDARVDVSQLQALPAPDAIIVADDHRQYADIVTLLHQARIDAPAVTIIRTGTAAALDALHEPASRQELRALHWLTTSERHRRDHKIAEAEVRDAAHLSELGKMVAHAAHEIRNPLTALSAKLQWLKRKAEGSALVVSASDGMLEEVHRLARVLNDMLEYGRSRIYSKRTSTEVAQTLNEVVALYRESCEQARVHLVLEHSDALLARVPFPSEELHQVFQNLLTNAIDATPPDETIRIIVTADSDDRLRVEFRNPGFLPDDVAEKAFELFFTTKPNGTGLGLPIVKRIVSGVAGQVEALNVDNQVVIRLTLPTVSS